MLLSGAPLTMGVEAMKNETLRKLKHMRLPAFAEAYQKQVENEIEYQTLTFHERLALLADAEFDSRHTNNILRLINNAKLTEPSASYVPELCNDEKS